MTVYTIIIVGIKINGFRRFFFSKVGIFLFIFNSTKPNLKVVLWLILRRINTRFLSGKFFKIVPEMSKKKKKKILNHWRVPKTDTIYFVYFWSFEGTFT